MDFIQDATVNMNSYSYVGTTNLYSQMPQSALQVIDPKSQEVDINMTLDQVTAQSPSFVSISAFKSTNFGNLAVVAMSNQTAFILNTLTSEIYSTFPLNFDDSPICQTINDEAHALFFCYSTGAATIELYQGEITTERIAQYYGSDTGFAYTPIPDQQRILYCTASALKFWSYANNMQDA